jgi:hypothetical protein
MPLNKTHKIMLGLALGTSVITFAIYSSKSSGSLSRPIEPDKVADNSASVAIPPAPLTSTQKVLSLISSSKENMLVIVPTMKPPIKFQDLMKVSVERKLFRDWVYVDDLKISNDKHASFVGYFTVSKDNTKFYMIKYICNNSFLPDANLKVRFYKATLNENQELVLQKSNTNPNLFKQDILSEGLSILKLNNKLGDDIVGVSNKSVGNPPWYQIWDGQSIRMYIGGYKYKTGAINLTWNETINGYEVDLIRNSDFEKLFVDKISFLYDAYFLVDDDIISVKHPSHADDLMKQCLVSSQ